MRGRRLAVVGALALLASLLMPSVLPAEAEPGEAAGDAVGPAGAEAVEAPPAEAADPGEPAPSEPAAPEQQPAGEPRATAAQATTVRMGDFFFAPASITVSVGETVTWVNEGEVPEGHTATASGGSFDTGVLQSGESASHTFTRAGTFPYVCSLHPARQRGTVTVRAAADPDPGPDPAAPAGEPGTPGSAPDAGGPAEAAQDEPSPAATRELAEGGWDVLAPLLAGLALLGLGIALARRVRFG